MAGGISIRDLTKRFGRSLAVDALAFDVEPGTVAGFVGPNGAGKTTTMRCLLGLARPTSGAAVIDDRPYAQLSNPITTVGAVLEGAAFYPSRTARDHLRVVGRAAGLPDRRADETLELVGLSDHARQRVGAYSMGMRQRLAIATALLGAPRVLVLDEPANGLDPAGIKWLRDFLRFHASSGGTVLISSHVLSEVALAADKVVIVDRGRLVKIATLDELRRGSTPLSRVRSPQAERLAALLRERGATVETTSDGALTVSLPPEEIGDLAAASSIPLHELVEQTATLEEAFFEVTGRAEEGGPGWVS